MSQIIEKVTNIVSDQSFAINMAMHSLILFSFLSVFFIQYISKLASKTFNHELAEIMESVLGGPIREAKKIPLVQEVLDTLPLDKLQQVYGKQDKAVQSHNDGLFTSILISNILLWGMLIIVILLINYSCGKNIDIKSIAVENGLTFMFIGVVEYLFFSLIAFKFVPVEPSFISQQMLEKVKNLF